MSYTDANQPSSGQQNRPGLLTLGSIPEEATNQEASGAIAPPKYGDEDDQPFDRHHDHY